MRLHHQLTLGRYHGISTREAHYIRLIPLLVTGSKYDGKCSLRPVEGLEGSICGFRICGSCRVAMACGCKVCSRDVTAKGHRDLPSCVKAKLAKPAKPGQTSLRNFTPLHVSLRIKANNDDCPWLWYVVYYMKHRLESTLLGIRRRERLLLSRKLVVSVV